MEKIASALRGSSATIKVTDVDIWKLSVPLKLPITWGWATRHGTSVTIIRLNTDAGVSGIGEIGPTQDMDVPAFVRKIVVPVLNEEGLFNIERIRRRLVSPWNARQRLRPFAGVEMAIWDLLGKLAGRPVYDMLGGQFRPTVSVAAYMYIKDPADLVAEAEARVAEGYGTVKIKIGADLHRDIELVAAVRKALGPKIEIRADVNQGWMLPTAVRQLRKLEEFDLQYIEQPLAITDLQALRSLRARSRVPIAVDEGVFTKEEGWLSITGDTCDVVLVDPEEAGGIHECKKLAAIAEAAGIPLSMHSGHELGVATAAWIHIAASTPNLIYAIDTNYPHLTDDVLVDELVLENGQFQIPRAPGLGIELDAIKLEKYSAMAERVTYSSFAKEETGTLPVRLAY